MAEAALPPKITAATLAARDEWKRRFADAEVLWQELVDEGVGIGFDGLDPSAMARMLCRTTASWEEILAWYQARLAELGWNGNAVRDPWWWEWRDPARPGERIQLLDRSRVPEALQAFADPSALPMFEVLFTARSSSHRDPGSDA